VSKALFTSMLTAEKGRTGKTLLFNSLDIDGLANEIKSSFTPDNKCRRKAYGISLHDNCDQHLHTPVLCSTTAWHLNIVTKKADIGPHIFITEKITWFITTRDLESSTRSCPPEWESHI